MAHQLWFPLPQMMPLGQKWCAGKEEIGLNFRTSVFWGKDRRLFRWSLTPTVFPWLALNIFGSWSGEKKYQGHAFISRENPCCFGSNFPQQLSRSHFVWSSSFCAQTEVRLPAGEELIFHGSLGKFEWGDCLFFPFFFNWCQCGWQRV